MPNFLKFIDDIANASPILNCAIVEEVGTMFPGPASTTFGISKFISADLYKSEFFDTIDIKCNFFISFYILNNIF